VPDVTGGAKFVKQLPLALRLSSAATFDNFITESNAEPVAYLRAAARGERFETVWLAGASGVGKTHLLQAVCHAATAAGRRAMYVPLAQIDSLQPTVLDGYEQLDVLAIDDLDQAGGRADWEQALFRVTNAFMANRGTLIMAADSLPKDSGLQLGDLRSRATAALVYQIAGLSEPGQQRALRQRAVSRGLELDATAARFLLSRVPRDMGAICDWLERLDAVSLAAQKKITVPLIRALLLDAGDAIKSSQD
jgi:DnaA family protein